MRRFRRYSLDLIASLTAVLILSSVPALGAPLFVLPVKYAGGGPIAVADLNGDGKLDLVVGARSGLYVRMGNGDGTFGPEKYYSSGGPCSIAIADVNGDGKPDIVLANCFSDPNQQNWNGAVGVLLGNGDGTFQSVVTYSSGGDCAFSVAVADLNGDGKPDVVITNWAPKSTGCNGNAQDGNVGVLLGNGDGTFQPVMTYDSGGQAADAVAVADLNGDGKPDLVVGNVNSRGFAVLWGNGDGTFQPAVIYYSLTDFAPQSVALADVNGDGRLDLLLGGFSYNCFVNSDQGAVWVFLGNGDGTFKYPKDYCTGGQSANQIATAEVNGDGKLDLAVANEWNAHKGVVGVLLGNGDGTFKPVIDFYPGVASDFVAMRDLTGDGRPELLASGYYGQMVVLLNNTAPWADYTRLTTSESPSYIGQPVTFTANVGSGDGELVTFYDGTNPMGKGTTLDGKASPTTSSLRVGTHSIRSIYPGDTVWTPSSGNVQQVVIKYPTTTTLTSSFNPSQYGQAITFTATVTASGPHQPVGSVMFKDGTVLLATKKLSGGVATLSTSKLAVATHSITAHYLGDTYNAASTSAVLNQVVQ